jgi:ABC-type bacteriocin/lantibiotic exporter with double-glycine peptidase domain
MGRSKASPIQQPDDFTCGPAAQKIALQILGMRKSLGTLIRLCKTSRNGTSTKNMVKAYNQLGLPVLVVENASLHHLQSALKYTANRIRAVMVNYLSEDDDNGNPCRDSGHWAVVSSYSASRSRIVLLDSAIGQKRSFAWHEFRGRWMDFDLKRRKIKKNGSRYKLVRRWQSQPLVIVAREPQHLPKFGISTAKIYLPRE